MKCHFISFFFYIIIITKIKLSFLSIEISSIFPVYRIVLSEDISKLGSNNYIRCDLESKGYGLIFNNNLNISLIPFNLFNSIREYYKNIEEISIKPINEENEYQEILLWANIDIGIDTIHFALENFGISIPIKYFFIEKDKKMKQYSIRFLTKKDQEYIIFGRDLIEIMDIEFKDENNFIIHNNEFITKLNE